jgi:trafficking protein particle complex subunit 5
MKKTGASGGGMNQTLADFAFERPLKPRPEVALSAFSFLLSEIVQHLMKSDKAGGDSSHGSSGGDLDQ